MFQVVNLEKGIANVHHRNSHFADVGWYVHRPVDSARDSRDKIRKKKITAQAFTGQRLFFQIITATVVHTVLQEQPSNWLLFLYIQYNIDLAFGNQISPSKKEHIAQRRFTEHTNN